MTGDKQPGVKWSGPEGSLPITLADFRAARSGPANSPSLGSPAYPDTPGLLAWLFGGEERSEQTRTDPSVHRCQLIFEKGQER